MAKKKGIDLEGMDLSKYGANRNTDEKEKVEKKTALVTESTEEQTIDEVGGIRAVRDIELKKKLITIPKHYEEAIKDYIEKTGTPIKKKTVQDFFLEAVEEKLVSLGY